MDILEFAEQVTKRVREKLGDRYRVEVHEVRKNNNVKLTGMVILPECLNISPTIYLDSFHEAYENGTISRVLTTNLVYQTEDLLEREWYINCDMSKYIAYLIDTLNHDTSISDLLNPVERITSVVARYNAGELG